MSAMVLTGRRVLSVDLTPAPQELYVSHCVAALAGAREEILTQCATVPALGALGICLTEFTVSPTSRTANMATRRLHKACFACHQPARDRNYVSLTTDLRPEMKFAAR